jgi:hypothetical protein
MGFWKRTEACEQQMSCCSKIPWFCSIVCLSGDSLAMAVNIRPSGCTVSIALQLVLVPVYMTGT